MKNIPDISFNNTENIVDFEFLNLVQLFARISKIKDHNPTQAHRITFFALLIVTKGTGTHQIDLKEYELKEGTVLRIAKGQIHAFQKEATYEGFLIIFTENFILNYFSKASIQTISHLYNYHITSPISNDKTLNQDFLSQLIPEIENHNHFAQKNITSALLNLYLLKLERKSQNNGIPSKPSKYYNTFMLFKNLVETHYSKTRNVKDYATMLSVSSKHLNQVVKEFTLNTAKVFIDNYVILEVKRDIVISKNSIKEIAFNTGFEEVTNFTKFFKNKTGVSPKVYRAKQ
ncbi:helix-turn-helix domain-containing protein [Algibacter miyuki]|uniref:Helix-turn-helix domain-containing protein n=1 Tax=Algibacter miyuki TaxID=1306933 RepID=A0ABV5H0A7_9FLAO|nr:helix-turn-helix transcriptional regulator [Algibacter miyuki]MDN3667433.1 helix-turn-helix transcriptional regulator [Algibacter miyuki]